MEGELKQNIILDMSFAFAVRIVELSNYLANEKKEYVLSRQVLRSGTSIGANVKEAVVAQSRKEFIAKLNISLKEANETEYWIQLLHATGYLDDVDSVLEDNRNIIRVLTSIIKSTNNNTPHQVIVNCTSYIVNLRVGVPRFYRQQYKRHLIVNCTS